MVLLRGHQLQISWLIEFSGSKLKTLADLLDLGLLGF